MNGKNISLAGAFLGAGLVVCIGLFATLAPKPLPQTVEPGPAAVPVVQVAKYQPSFGEQSTPIRRARNDAMADPAADNAIWEPCPRCR